jgi:hypothetical protein
VSTAWDAADIHDEDNTNQEGAGWIHRSAGMRLDWLDRRGTEEEGTMGMRWMPWRRVPKKDVDNCDKRRGAGTKH